MTAFGGSILTTTIELDLGVVLWNPTYFLLFGDNGLTSFFFLAELEFYETLSKFALKN